MADSGAWVVAGASVLEEVVDPAFAGEVVFTILEAVPFGEGVALAATGVGDFP